MRRCDSLLICQQFAVSLNSARYECASNNFISFCFVFLKLDRRSRCKCRRAALRSALPGDEARIVLLATAVNRTTVQCSDAAKAMWLPGAWMLLTRSRVHQARFRKQGSASTIQQARFSKHSSASTVQQVIRIKWEIECVWTSVSGNH